jgi:hypothetical protein
MMIFLGKNLLGQRDKVEDQPVDLGPLPWTDWHAADRSTADHGRGGAAVPGSRRLGKTHLALRELARFAQFPRQRVYYTAPTYRQAKSIAWMPLKEKLIELRWVEKVNEQDLSITLRNASTISVRGTDFLTW